MSSSVLRLISVDPTLTPILDDEPTVRAAIDAAFPGANRVELRLHDTPVFVDQGENFESVACPSCDRTLDMTWWQEAMDAAAGCEFLELAVETPCCSAQTSLNELKYDMPAGFARFMVEIAGPGIAGFVEPSKLLELEELFGTRLRQIFARY